MMGRVVGVERPRDAAARGRRHLGGVLFDVDGTLYHQFPLRACMAGELAAATLTLGSWSRALLAMRVLRAYRKAHEDLRPVAVHGDEVAVLQIVNTARRVGCAESQVRAIVAEWMMQRPLKYLPWCRRGDVLPLLRRLRDGGVLLGVLSDYPCEGKLVSLGIREFFSVVLCTTDASVNALKPDPRGFWRACELWNLPPEEVLYVGDRPEVDARGAVAAGLQCAVIRRNRPRGGLPCDRSHVQLRRLQDVAHLCQA